MLNNLSCVTDISRRIETDRETLQNCAVLSCRITIKTLPVTFHERTRGEGGVEVS